MGGQRSEVSKRQSAKQTADRPTTDPRPPNPDFPKFRTTHEMIKAIEEGRFPEKAMITIHPQRWHDRAVPWVKELVW